MRIRRLSAFVFRCLYFLTILFTIIPAYSSGQKISPFEDSLLHKSFRARLNVSDSNRRDAQRTTSQQCNTSTFYMRMLAAPGQKIDLKEIQTQPDGNFLAVGNISLASGEKEGLLLRMANSGAILQQNKLRVNNYSTNVHDCEIMWSGKMLIAGTIDDVNNSVFVSVLNSDLTTEWLRVFNMPFPSLKMSVSIFDTTHIAWATQLADGSISYSVLTGSGTLTWDKKASPPGLTNLVGFGFIGWSHLGLVTNCIRNGKQVVEVIQVSKSAGQHFSTHIIGDGSAENKFLETTSFSGRQMSVGISKTAAGQFRLVRNNMYASGNIETEHTYFLPGNMDFNVTGAIDIAADLMGLCLPQDGKLIFIKHFNSYQTGPEYIRQYTVPTGSSVTSVTRAWDGGFLFGLRTIDSSSLIFVKTDSIGNLPGCGSADIPINYTETLNKQNTVSSPNDLSAFRTGNAGTLSFGQPTLTTQFDCNSIYCPPPPPVDTCLNTYFKTMRSNSYVDAFSYYFLMRNNKHLAVTRRYDRFLIESNRLTYGLKLFDEAGKFIKGVDVFVDSVSEFSMARQFDDQTIMLVNRTVKNGSLYLTFTLVSDDLQMLWTRTIKTFNDFNYYNGGTTGELHRDAEGNFYFVATALGFIGTPKVLVYKMDISGNQAWLKAYELQSGLFGPARAVSTATSLIIFIESSNGGVTVQFDKSTGQMLNGFKHQIDWAGSVYERFVKYENQKIYYAGNHTDSRFAMGIFDSIGRPVKVRVIDFPGSGMRAAGFKSGSLYGSFNYFSGSVYRNVLFKTDPNLNFLFANDFAPIKYGLPCGLDISDNGSIYVGGNSSYGVNSHYDPYIVKYNSNGELGTCSSVPMSIPFYDLSTNYTSLTFSPVQVTIASDNLPVHFLPDSMGQTVSALLCSSTQLCDTVYLNGPGKVCRLNEGYTYRSFKNPGCTLQPSWIYDTTYIRVQSLTDTVAKLEFKRTGSTWIKVKLQTGCVVYQDSLLVDIQISPSSISLGKDTSFCPGDTVVLNAGGGFSSYTWQNGSTDSIYYGTVSGQYFVQAVNACGDTYYDTVILSMVTVPNLYIGNDTLICRNDTLEISATPGFSSYSWTPSSLIIGQGQQISVSPLQATMIAVEASTLGGCHSFDTLTLAIREARSVFVGNDTSFCAGQSVTLSTNNNYADYHWSTGSVAPYITINQPGSYWVNVVDTNSCTTSDTMIVLAVHQLPSVNLGNDFDLCLGEQKRLDGGDFSLHNWQDGSSGRYFLIRDTGTYWVSVMDNNSCAGSDTVNVINIKPIPSDFLISADSICQYSKVELAPNQQFLNYRWSTGSNQTTTTVENPGSYILTVIDANGCEGSDTIRVFQKNCYSGVFIPTAFTPNGDQLNDVFRARVYGSVIKFSLELYNRNGELVFTSDDHLKGWNGIYKGIPQSTAVFVWQCSYQLEGGHPKFEKGFVTLIR